MICAPRYCGQSTFCEMCISKYKAEEIRDRDYQMGSVWDWDGDYCADHEFPGGGRVPGGWIE